MSRKAVELLVTKAFTNSSLCRGKHWNIKSICFFVCDKFEIKLLKLIQTPERQNPERKIPEKLKIKTRNDTSKRQTSEGKIVKDKLRKDKLLKHKLRKDKHMKLYF